MEINEKHVNVDIKSNITHGERIALQELKNNSDIILKKTDKSKSIAIQDKDSYIDKINSEHLSDTSTYEEIPTSARLIKQLEDKLNAIWTKISKRNQLSRNWTDMLKQHNSNPGEFYGLLKDHKKIDSNGQFPQRPVVSGINTATEKMSWLIDRTLRCLIDKIPAHLNSEDELISILDKLVVDPDTSLFSLDVVALYPSIPIDDAIKAIIELALDNKTEVEEYGIHIEEIEEVLKLILNNNIIKFGDKCFIQKKGVAMGNRLAPLVAIIFMHSLEEKARQNHPNFPKFYKRYIDDCLCTWNNSCDLDGFLQFINTIHPNIRFTVEKQDKDGWLSFLRSQLKIKNTHIERKYYRKPTSKDIFLHAMSHHSEVIKRNSIINEFRCIDKICSNEIYYKEASNVFKNILLSNGYNQPLIDSLEKKGRSIYHHLKYIFRDNDDSCSTTDNSLNSFLYNHQLRIHKSPGDGHCLLHSINTATGIPLIVLKGLIITEFNKNPGLYSIGTEGHHSGNAQEQLRLYIDKKIYNLPIVDNIPILLANCLGNSLYIFQDISSKTLISKFSGTDSNSKPILLRRNNDHYDTIISYIKWNNNISHFKNEFNDSSILKLPYISEEHCKEVKNVLSKSNICIIPIFTPGRKIIEETTRSALKKKECHLKNCPYNNKLCQNKNVIYELKCTECDESYIGETKRTLHTRANEHAKSIFNDKGNSAMRDHYNSNHPNLLNEKPFETTILDKTYRCTDRKIRESIWIRRKNPEINRDKGWITKSYKK